MSLEVQRKLTTILAADAEGFSRVMEADEVQALGALRAARGVFAKFIERHHGRIANTAGDGLIAEFPSVVEAVQCAIEVQQELGTQQGDPGGRLRFRIGIHLGDVMVDGDDLLGEGVNLAARLQTMAEPGGVLISQQVYDQVHAKLSVGFEYLGEKRPKNFSEDVAVYCVSSSRQKPRSAKPKPSSRKTRAHQLPDEETTDHDGLRDRVVRQAKIFGAIAALLVVVDIVTGPGLWAHFPVIALSVVVLLRATPLFTNSWFNIVMARAAVVAGALVVINLVTWSGYFWAIWPLIGFVFLNLLRRLGSRPR